MKAFRRAVEKMDLVALTDLFAEDIVFHSPVSFKPYEGKQTVGWILATVAQVFQDFVYTGETENGPLSALVFRTRIGDKTAEGIDLIECNTDGKIKKLTVFIRPASAVMALGEEMKRRLTGD